MNNAKYAEVLKSSLGLRYEPVAVKLVRDEEQDPQGYVVPEKQMSHCQAVMSAKEGSAYYVPTEMQGCNNGATALGMKEKPEKLINGEFYFGFGMHDTQEAAANMVATRAEVPMGVKGVLVAPLKDVDFVPDSVIIVDVPEVAYWFIPLQTHKEGGRAKVITAPFQAVCVDATTYPIMNQDINFSLGCFGCRKKTNIRKDEMLVGFPGSMLQDLTETLEKYAADVLTKAKRD